MMKFLFLGLVLLLQPLFATDGDRLKLETDSFSLFPYPGHVKADAQGRIFIADLGANTIRVFDKDVKYLFQIGRAGEGPGEFKRWFGEFDLAPDGRIFQVDYWAGNRWVNVFEPDGKFVKVIPLTAFEGVFGPQRVLPIDSQTMIIGVENSWHAEKKGPLYFNSAMQNYHLMKQDGSLGARLASRDVVLEISKFPDKEGRPIPNQAYFLSALNRAGQYFAYQRSDEGQVTLVNLKTLEQKVYPNGFKRRRAGKESIEAFVEDRLANFTSPEFRTYETQLYGDMVNYADSVEQFQGIVDRIFFNPEGHLFLTMENPLTHKHDVRKLNVDGKIQEQFKVEMVPETFSGDKAIYLVRDEEQGQGYLIIRPRQKF